MKFGNLPTEYEDGECPFDALEEEDYFFILDYKGSCQNCGEIQIPYMVWVIFQRTDTNYHVFVPMEDLKCGGCGATVRYISVMCSDVLVDVTGEFGKLSEK